MKFIYDENIDKKCKKELDAYESIFGQKKKIDSFTINKEIINNFNGIWTDEIEKKFLSIITKIFGEDLPKDFVLYLNTTPYSMDIKEGISISISTKTPIRTICHETNHYMFRKSSYKEKYFNNKDMEEAKEIFTIINNIYFQDLMENQDLGWPKFWKDRYNFLKIWIKNELI